MNDIEWHWCIPSIHVEVEFEYIIIQDDELMIVLCDILADILINISNIDQYIQLALNSATDTVPLIASIDIILLILYKY